MRALTGYLNICTIALYLCHSSLKLYLVKGIRGLKRKDLTFGESNQVLLNYEPTEKISPTAVTKVNYEAVSNSSLSAQHAQF